MTKMSEIKPSDVISIGSRPRPARMQNAKNVANTGQSRVVNIADYFGDITPDDIDRMSEKMDRLVEKRTMQIRDVFLGRNN